MVQVVGWHEHANIGDDSYQTSFRKLFPNQTLVFSDPAIVPDAEDIILGGGNILEPPFVKKVLAAKGRKIAFSVSASPTTPLELLSGFDQIFVRDRWSYDHLQKHQIDCFLAPDASVILTGNPQQGLSLIREKFTEARHELYQKRVGIVFNAYLLAGGQGRLARDFFTFQKVCNDLAKIVDETSASFIFFPMSTGMPQDDRATNAFLANSCKFWQKNLVVYDKFSVQQTLDLIAACDVIVSTRLHSTIFAVNNQIPFLDIVHHDKNKAYLRSWDLEESGFSYWNFDSSSFQDRLRVLLEDGSVYKGKLTEIHRKQLSLLEEGTKHVCFNQLQ